MTHAIEADLGPLTWVKSEIDLALDRTTEALDQAARAEDAAARIQFAQTHLHQVRGALSIVGLDGLTQFAAALDQVLGKLARTTPVDAAGLALAHRALASIGNYLDEIAHGATDQSLRLAPLYTELVVARGDAPPSPVDLFFPDLALRPARRRTASASENLTPDSLRQLRARYERGLLEWLRDARSVKGLKAMRSAIADIEALQKSAPARSLWWASLAFFDALADGALKADATARRLCTQLDTQMRRLMAGNPAIPDRLMRELLYCVAVTPARTEQQKAVRATWRLDTLLPQAGSRLSDIPLAPLLQTIRTQLTAAKEAWDEFSSGTAAALPRFGTLMNELAEPVGRLGRPVIGRLTKGILNFGLWLQKDPLRFSEAVGLEVATALLLAETTLDRRALETSVSTQVDDALARLDALTQGKSLPAALPASDIDSSRRAQEKEAVSQLSKEILSSLAHVEQTLDDYFRNQNKRAPLALLSGPMQQIEGALTLLGETDAIALAREASETIARFANEQTETDPGEFQTLAHHLSALGFYVESLQHSRTNLKRLLEPDVSEEAEEDEVVEIGDEDEFAVEALPVAQEAPTPVTKPVGTSTTTLRSKPAGTATTTLRDVFEAEPKPALEVPKPAEATRKLIEASDEEIDAELLCIFIEEAHEVLATIGEQFELSRTNPTEKEHLIAVRRGFHTLKGSGRMVGLRDFGEAAWGLEQTLNRWLQLEWPLTPELHHLVSAAQQFFGEWVAQLESGGPNSRDASELTAEAERLRATETPEPLPAATDAPAADTPTAATQTILNLSDLDLSLEDESLPAESGAQAQKEEGFHPEKTQLGFTPHDAAPAQELSLDLEEMLAPLSELIASDESPRGQASESTASVGLFAAGELDFELDAGETPAVDLTSLIPPSTPATEAELAADEPIVLDAFTLDASDIEFNPLESGSIEITSLEEESLPGEMPPPDVIADDIIAPEIGIPEISVSEAGIFEEIHPESVEAPETPPTEAPPATTASPALDWNDNDTIHVGDIELPRPLYDLFLTEAQQHLGTLHREFARLGTNPVLLSSEEALRAAHTLAGISSTAHVIPMQTLARALEHALRRLQDQSRPPGTDLPLFATAADTLDAMLAEVGQQRMPLNVPELVGQLEQSVRHTSAPAPKVQSEPAPAAAQPETPADITPEPAAPVHDDIDTQLLPIFLEESAELLSQLHATLRTWQSEPDDDGHRQAIARQLHTLKGSARMAGAMTLGEHLHQIESRLETALKSHRPAAAVIDDIATGLDITEQLIDNLATGGMLAPSVATPAVTAIQEEITVADTEMTASATLRVRADLIDRFVNEAGEIGIARTRIDGELRTLRRSLLDLTENVIRLRNQLREVEIQAEVQMQSRIAHAESAHSQFDPLEMDRYTRLQELTRMMAESVNDVTTVQQNLLKNLDGADIALHSQARLSRELQQALMRVRMVPFDSLADRLYRIVRQGAKDLNKRANLDLRGGRIEIDRSVLEHMVAPLEHLLRNALAHGIEAPDARRAAGKPEIGQLTLSVAQEGNEIAIELTDDGRGLDFTRIAERARENGLFGANEAVDERRLTNLIFVPGFTTAGTVSTVSGRGVGMDVVKTETASLGGRIDVNSKPGSGTTFRIYLPLTLAVTQALLVRAGGHTYAIPSSMVAQVLELKPDALEHLRENRGIDWLNERYTYRYLPRLLGDRESRPEIQRYNWMLLLRAGAQTLALHVDGLRGNQEIVVKNAGPQLNRIVGMSGATVLGDGEIVLILNPVALASRGLGDENDEAADDHAGIETADTVQEPPTVLIVDDSLTVRKITGRLLEREGYRVLTAKDGVDGLEKLIETVPDVILSDIEMPRMDGFDFVRNVRADSRTRDVPVIMITSRLADKHRRYAAEIGANHYLGKPYQEEELLELLARHTGRFITA